MCKWDFFGLFFVHLFGTDGQVGGKWYEVWRGDG